MFQITAKFFSLFFLLNNSLFDYLIRRKKIISLFRIFRYRIAKLESLVDKFRFSSDIKQKRKKKEEEKHTDRINKFDHIFSFEKEIKTLYLHLSIGITI